MEHAPNNTRQRLDIFILLAIMVILSATLIWVTGARVSEYRAHEARNGALTAEGAAKEIAAGLHGLRRAVSLFAATELPLLGNFARDPDNDTLYAELSQRVKQVFPEAFAVTLADQEGQPLRTDFDGLVGQLCQRDIAHYVRDPHGLNIYIHPNMDTYHFDVMTALRGPQGEQWVFFVSFNSTALARVLSNYQLFGHTLYLLRSDTPGLIELTSTGSRNTLTRDFHLTDAERARIKASVPIAGTLWNVVDIPDQAVQRKVVNRLWTEAVVLLVVLGLFSMFVLRRLLQAARSQREYTRMLEHTASQLRENTQRIHAIVDSAIDAVITIDHQGLIESFNPAAERIFGYEAREVIGENIRMLMPEPYQSAHDGYLERYRQTGQRHIIGSTREAQARRKTGELFPIELSISESVMGEERFFTGMIRDISQRKKLERIQREFVSTVSHELRTPLTAIKGSLGLLLGGAAGSCPEPAVKLLDLSMKNCERLNLLINDILDMEKIESGKLHFEMQCLELHALLQQALDHNHHYAAQYDVQYVLGGLIPGLWVNVDPDRLAQVLANLLSNAAKFSPAGETVTLSMSRPDDRHVRVSIRDKGKGIPESFRDRIFQKFAQADSTDTREKGGSGLGLSISRALVERMNGRIDFDTIPGEGTTFYFDLPLCKKPD